MIQAMPEAALIWQEPYDMLVEWDLNPHKLMQERTVAEFAGDCGNLVDLGCGNGRLARVMKYDSYQGYDGSYLMIMDARRRNPELQFALLDIFKFQSDETYDTALLLDVAIHQTDPVAAVKLIISNWQSKRYVFSLLVGERHEELLNSVVISYSELHQLLGQRNVNLRSEVVLSEPFMWYLIDYQGD